jgi:hypothetical protein
LGQQGRVLTITPTQILLCILKVEAAKEAVDLQRRIYLGAKNVALSEKIEIE